MPPKPKSTKLKTSKITLQYHAPQASSVYVVGSFCNWDTNKHPLKKDRKGHWKTVLTLPLGRYEYRFIVDGEWRDEQNPIATVANPFGSCNFVVEVTK